MSKISMVKARNASGNMLFLVVLTIGALIGLGLSGFMFNKFLCQCARAQAKVDELAVSFAGTLNKGNRVGQMNELEERSRELVYLSRRRCNNCRDQEASFLAPLCYQLLVEARQGHNLVEEERQNQIHLISAELQQATLNYNSAVDAAAPLNFCWLATREPRIENVWLGRVANTDSNVRSRDVLAELAAFDRSQRYTDPTSNLFKADINARLPEDGDLDFKISSLPANVDGSCAPPRNVNPDAFIPARIVVENGEITPVAACDQIPNAVQIVCAMTATLPAHTRAAVSLVSSGVTCGDSAIWP